MNDYRRELAEVKEELSELEVQIEDLLQGQASLQDRKKELETILSQNSSKSNEDADKWDRSDFEWTEELKAKMKGVFHIDKLRPLQLQTMNVTLSGKDCILIMPTGGGKSLCFQLPAILSTGITLVVSPLVSLMEDQTMALENIGVEATLLNASSTKETVNYVHAAMTDKNTSLKLLYVTPEKLAKSKRFMAKLEKMFKVGLFARLVIDEVHCCSQWGHDFRPDYKFLGIMKRQFPGVPILGLTATATIKVIEDVKNILNLRDPYLFKASFNRPNLYYEVREKPSSLKETMNEMHKLIQSKFKGQSGIIYCFSRKDSDDVAAELRSRGIRTGVYHSDCSARERSRVHKAWLSGQIQVVVATVAFGMGIDKPDVRFVIHHSLSKSMENLYQESGRAGRDDKMSHCILFYRFADVFRQSTMVFTEQTGLTNLYGIMEYCTDMKKCRRSIIARHFGEVWDKTQCNSMCDHCNSLPVPKERKDVTKVCLNVLAILNQAENDDNRITAQKLVDSLQGRGPASLKVPGMENPKVSRDKLERIVAQMLLLGIVREDFHFTPYSTISYIVKGPKAKLLQTGKVKVDMDFPAKTPKSPGDDANSTVSSTPEKHINSSKIGNSVSSPVKIASSHVAGNTSDTGKTKTKPVTTKSRKSNAVIGSSHSLDLKDSKKSEKSVPKLVVINKEHSRFTDITGSACSDSANKDSGLDKSTKKNFTFGKKRKPTICESDSDDLDFDEEKTRTKPPVKKSKPKVKKSQKLQNGAYGNGYGNLDLDASIFDEDFEPSIFDENFEPEPSTSKEKINLSIKEHRPILIESDSGDDSDLAMT